MRVGAGVTISKYSYGGDGTRRKRLDANGTIHYAGSYEHNLGTNQAVQDTVTKYYTASLGGTTRLLAFRKGGTLSYRHSDK